MGLRGIHQWNFEEYAIDKNKFYSLDINPAYRFAQGGLAAAQMTA